MSYSRAGARQSERREIAVARGAMRGAVSTHEDRDPRKRSRSSPQRLTWSERAELETLWGGYEAAIGMRSLHGATESVLLKSPPSDVRKIVMAEMDRLSGHAERDGLVRAIAEEREATAYEARRAIGSLIGSGHLVAAVSEVKRRRWNAETERFEEYTADAEFVHLARRLKRDPPPRTTREERWAAADEEIERECRGGPSCKDDDYETQAPAMVGTGPVGSERAVRGLPLSLQRVLRRLYGNTPPPPYALVLGDEVARAAEFTPIVARRRKLLVEHLVASQVAAMQAAAKEHQRTCEQARAAVAAGGRIPVKLREQARTGPMVVDETAIHQRIDHAVTAADALRWALEDAPSDPAARAKWRGEREAFIKRVRVEAEKIIVDACRSYRAARRG